MFCVAVKQNVHKHLNNENNYIVPYFGDYNITSTLL